MALEVMARATAPIPLDIAFRVEPGELLALVGHSGSGKSTLLRTIAGLWTPSEARVAVNGETWLDTGRRIDLAPHRRRVGIVFQSYALFPHMTALGNVVAAMGHRAAPERGAEARRLLALVNLSGLEARKPAELSGGQQQRVAVARALARQPAALLLDEPFSAVDRATRERLYEEIRQLRAHLAMPTILVTHDMEEARLLADRMVVIEHGRVVRAGATADVMFDPAALRAMGLREIGSSLRAVIAAHEDDELTRLQSAAGPVWLPRIDGAPGAPVRLRIMAHDVMISRERPGDISALNVLPASVIAVTDGEGPGVIVRLDVSGDEILARITVRSARALALAPGAACFAIVKSMAAARGDVEPTAR
ncbi:molybdenum ABC transporter ATP-binding protein [Aquibium carbonis]|uniref:Molybdenum ABC transporter ATP-binding protein n=1 Tax=Aquibium carbonis TaxID=2495581 RepID=A0A429YTV8_9HYPH|nr:molybdenum ABC transporter ATP-binding protein [Aquibium carbonis]RST84888.1 molybdenum ABC transporter ATP-binding protein [Aquibium carbonis]